MMVIIVVDRLNQWSSSSYLNIDSCPNEKSEALSNKAGYYCHQQEHEESDDIHHDIHDDYGDGDDYDYDNGND